MACEEQVFCERVPNEPLTIATRDRLVTEKRARPHAQASGKPIQRFERRLLDFALLKPLECSPPDSTVLRQGACAPVSSLPQCDEVESQILE